MKLSRILFLALLSGLAPALNADTVVTLFGEDSAHIRTSIELELEAGITDFTHSGVSPYLKAETLILHDPSDKPRFEILEQRIQRINPTGQDLLAYQQGKTLQFESKEGKIAEGLLVSAEKGSKPIVEFEGKYQVGLPGTPIYTELPPLFANHPTLLWKIETIKEGQYTGQLLYDTSKLSWKAHYTAFIAPEQQTANLTGSIALSNFSGEDFPDAQFHIQEGTREGDIVSLPRRTDLSNFETKQIEYLKARNLKTTSLLICDLLGVTGPSRRPESQSQPTVIDCLSLSPGKPLPAGTIQAFRRSKEGNLTSLGENLQIHSTRAEEPVEINLGPASGINVFLNSLKPVSSSIRFTNSRDKAVEIDARISLPDGVPPEPKNTTHPYKIVTSGRIDFKVPVPAKGETVLTYTLDHPDAASENKYR